MFNLSIGAKTSFKGKIECYSTANNQLKHIKTIEGEGYLDEDGFNSDERRVRTLTRSLNKPALEVNKIGECDKDKGKAHFSFVNKVNNTLESIKVENGVLITVLVDKTKNTLIKWTIDLNKDIKEAHKDIKENFYKGLNSLIDFLNDIKLLQK